MTNGEVQTFYGTNMIFKSLRSSILNDMFEIVNPNTFSTTPQYQCTNYIVAF